MIRLLIENQFSNCFITLFSPSCIASIFLCVISILIASASWIFKGKSLISNKNRGAPKLTLGRILVLFPYAKIIYIYIYGFFLLCYLFNCLNKLWLIS
jgi:hypothetical protein